MYLRIKVQNYSAINDIHNLSPTMMAISINTKGIVPVWSRIPENACLCYLLYNMEHLETKNLPVRNHEWYGDVKWTQTNPSENFKILEKTLICKWTWLDQVDIASYNFTHYNAKIYQRDVNETEIMEFCQETNLILSASF